MEFLGIIGRFGIAPLVTLLLIILIMIFKEIKKETGNIKGSILSLRASFEKEIEALEKRQNESEVKQDKIIDSLERRIREIEASKTDIAYVQEAVSGWRSEIGKISDRIDRLIMEMKKNGN